jgi:hypothetical protein
VSRLQGDGQAGGMERSQRPAVHLVSPLRTVAAALVLATPLATWWLVGDLSEGPAVSGQRPPDYMVRPPQLDEALEAVLGGGATLVAIAALVTLAVATWQGGLEPHRWRVIAPPLVAGVYCGYAGRVMTAAVHGANIGGGMMLLFGMVLVPAMLATAITQAHRQHALPRRSLYPGQPASPPPWPAGDSAAGYWGTVAGQRAVVK